MVDALAHALLAAGRTSTSQSELEVIRALGTAAGGDASAGVASLREALGTRQALDSLAAAVWAGLARLVGGGVATAAELQEKFLDDGAGTLSYAGLSTFFKGLEGKVRVCGCR